MIVGARIKAVLNCSFQSWRITDISSSFRSDCYNNPFRPLYCLNAFYLVVPPDVPFSLACSTRFAIIKSAMIVISETTAEMLKLIRHGIYIMCCQNNQTKLCYKEKNQNQ